VKKSRPHHAGGFSVFGEEAGPLEAHVNLLLTTLRKASSHHVLRQPQRQGESMMLVTLPGKILHSAHHTLLLMQEQEAGSCQPVCVVRDRLIGDVTSKLGLIERIASRKLDQGDVAFDGRVWITPSDLPRPAVERRH
jgi:hypothetical protein